MFITRSRDICPSFFLKASTYFVNKVMAQEINAKPVYFFQLSAKRLFGDLPRQSRKTFAAIKQTKLFPKNARLFAIGEMPCCIFLPIKGKVQIFTNDKKIVQFIEPDEIFGLTEAIVNQPYEINAETLTPFLCDCIGRDDFIRFLQAEPEMCFRLAQMLGFNLQKSYQLFISSMI